MHAILTSLGTDGDVFPYLGLARELIRRGHRVTLAVPESFESLARAAGADFHSLVTVAEAETIFANPDLWHPVKGGVLMARWGRALVARQFDLLAQLSQQGQSILVANPGVLAARLVRDRYGIPLVSIVLQPGIIPSNFSPPMLPAGPQLSPNAPLFIKESYWWMLDLVGYFLTGRELNRIRKIHGLEPIQRLFRWWFSPDLILGMFPTWFAAPPPDWPAQFESVDFPGHDGRSMSALPPEAIEFLDSGSAPIAFTPGSEVRNSRTFFEKAVEACGKLGSRGLFLTKHRDGIPAMLPETIKHFEYLPFQSVFPRCSAVVHHGGIGTVSKALCAGVPQVIRPLGWDQFDNADRVVKLGVGAVIKRHWPRRSSMPSQLKIALSSKVRARCREVMLQSYGEDANQRAVTSIESLFARFHVGIGKTPCLIDTMGAGQNPTQS